MVRADKRVMQAFLSPDGAVIKKFLEECLETKDADCRQMDGNMVYRAQGAAQELEEIVGLANNARDALN